MKRNLPYLALILVLAGIMYFRGRVTPAEKPPMFAQGLTLAEAMAKSSDTGPLVLAMATADWCGPCQVFKRGALRDPRVEQWVAEHALAVYIDVDKSPEVGLVKVMQIPTLILYRGDRELGRVSGVVDANDLLTWFNTASASTGDPARSPP